MNNLTIEPLKGYGDIRFGMSVDEIVNIFGELLLNFYEFLFTIKKSCTFLSSALAKMKILCYSVLRKT